MLTEAQAPQTVQACSVWQEPVCTDPKGIRTSAVGGVSASGPIGLNEGDFKNSLAWHAGADPTTCQIKLEEISGTLYATILTPETCSNPNFIPPQNPVPETGDPKPLNSTTTNDNQLDSSNVTTDTLKTVTLGEFATELVGTKTISALGFCLSSAALGLAGFLLYKGVKRIKSGFHPSTVDPETQELNLQIFRRLNKSLTGRGQDSFILGETPLGQLESLFSETARTDPQLAHSAIVRALTSHGPSITKNEVPGIIQNVQDHPISHGRSQKNIGLENRRKRAKRFASYRKQGR